MTFVMMMMMIMMINGFTFSIVFFSLAAINDALDRRDNDALICALKMPYCRLRDVAETSASLYMIELLSARQCKPGVSFVVSLLNEILADDTSS